MLGMITGDASRPLAPPGALDGCHHASVDRHRQRGAHGRAPPAPAPLAPALGIARRPRRHPRTRAQGGAPPRVRDPRRALVPRVHAGPSAHPRSEEHTSELQSLAYLVCRLLLEKKKLIFK